MTSDGGRSRLRIERPNESFHYEGPHGPMDVRIAKAEDGGRLATVRGPHLADTEMTLDAALSTIRRADLLRNGLTVRVGDNTVRLRQPTKGFRRSRRTLLVERPDRPEAVIRMRRRDTMSLERAGTPVARHTYRRGWVSASADATDVAILVLAACASLRRDVSLG